MPALTRYRQTAAASLLSISTLLAAEIDTPTLNFQVSFETGAYEIRDKVANVTWRSHAERFGEVTLNLEGKQQRGLLTHPVITSAPGMLTLEFHPVTNQPAAVRVTVERSAASRRLTFRYTADPALSVESVRLLDSGFSATDSGNGYVVVPVREGLLVPANSG